MGADIHQRWLRTMPLTARRAVISAIFAPVLFPSKGKPADPGRFRMPLNGSFALGLISGKVPLALKSALESANEEAGRGR